MIEATFLFPTLVSPFTTAKLLVTCACQLAKHEDRLAVIQDLALRSRPASALDLAYPFASPRRSLDLQFAALRLVPYCQQSSRTFEVMQIVLPQDVVSAAPGTLRLYATEVG